MVLDVNDQYAGAQLHNLTYDQDPSVLLLVWVTVSSNLFDDFTLWYLIFSQLLSFQWFKIQVRQVGAVVDSAVVVKMMMINLIKQAQVELKVSIRYFHSDNSSFISTLMLYKMVPFLFVKDYHIEVLCLQMI